MIPSEGEFVAIPLQVAFVYVVKCTVNPALQQGKPTFARVYMGIWPAPRNLIQSL
jgi:hypothetical protein